VLYWQLLAQLSLLLLLHIQLLRQQPRQRRLLTPLHLRKRPPGPPRPPLLLLLLGQVHAECKAAAAGHT
jgi:hypothetical protein